MVVNPCRCSGGNHGRQVVAKVEKKNAEQVVW